MVKEYGYEYDAVLNDAVWDKTRGKVTFEKLWGAMCLRSGRDTLKTIAREFLPTKVFMPALACDSMILPFEMYGHEVVYYRLNEDYSIDLKYLSTVIDSGIFMYMDYFGRKAIPDKKLAELKNAHDLIFVEDRTHNLIWNRKSKFEPDFIMASLRKWINVPDGGLLWCNRELRNTEFTVDTTFSETRLKAQCMRNQYLETGDEALKTNYRKIFSTVSNIIDSEKNASYMSLYSYELALQTDWNIIREQRKNNAKQLMSALENTKVRFIQHNIGESDLYVPFMLDHRDAKQALLSKKGIFNTIIWPLSNMQKDICVMAKYTEEHMLAAPCDQRYTQDDMTEIGKEMAVIFSE